MRIPSTGSHRMRRNTPPGESGRAGPQEGHTYSCICCIFLAHADASIIHAARASLLFPGYAFALALLFAWDTFPPRPSLAESLPRAHKLGIALFQASALPGDTSGMVPTTFCCPCPCLHCLLQPVCKVLEGRRWILCSFESPGWESAPSEYLLN